MRRWHGGEQAEGAAIQSAADRALLERRALALRGLRVGGSTCSRMFPSVESFQGHTRLGKKREYCEYPKV